MPPILLFSNGTQSGPHSFDEIKELLDKGTISPATLAWHEGLPEWVPVSAIVGAAQPPPINKQSSVAEPPRKLKIRAYWDALWEKPWCMKIGLWAGLLPLAIGLPLLLSFRETFAHQHDANTITTQGVAATAELVRIDTNQFMTINDVHPEKVFFQYKIGDAVKIASMDTLSVNEVADWKPGRQIPIRYLGDEATIPSLEPVEFPLTTFLMLPLNAMAIGLPFLLYCGILARKRIGLMRNGILRSARLESLAESKPFPLFLFSRSSRTRATATYLYLGTDGKQIKGTATTSDLLFMNKKTKGEEVEILIDPHQETKSILVDGTTLVGIEK